MSRLPRIFRQISYVTSPPSSLIKNKHFLNDKYQTKLLRFAHFSRLQDSAKIAYRLTKGKVIEIDDCQEYIN